MGRRRSCRIGVVRGCRNRGVAAFSFCGKKKKKNHEFLPRTNTFHFIFVRVGFFEAAVLRAFLRGPDNVLSFECAPAVCKKVSTLSINQFSCSMHSRTLAWGHRHRPARDWQLGRQRLHAQLSGLVQAVPFYIWWEIATTCDHSEALSLSNEPSSMKQKVHSDHNQSQR